MKSYAAIFYFILFIIACMAGDSEAVSPVHRNLLRIPITFTENVGQSADSIQFTSHMSKGGLSFSPSGITFLLSRETDASQAKRAAKRSVVFTNSSEDPEPVEMERHILHLRFEGANENPAISGESRLPWNSNYFRGNNPGQWKTDVPNYTGVRYHDLYQGVDLVYTGHENKLKYDFIIRPGSDISGITLSYEGASGIRVNEAGDLEVNTPAGTVIEKKPYCYQEIDGRKAEVNAWYVIRDWASCSYGFETGPYNTAYPLIIDPELVFSTFLGGKDLDGCIEVAVDKQRYIYLAGGTTSQDFPVSSSAYDSTLGDSSDVCITKFDPSGASIIYSTYLGGSIQEFPFGMDVDGEGNVCIAGVTRAHDYPKTPGAYTSPDISFFQDDNRVFVTKMNSSGNKLVFSAVFGNPHSSWNSFMKLDGEANVCVAGLGQINTTPDAIQKSPIEESNPTPFIFKLSADGSTILYSTYFYFGDNTVGPFTHQVSGMDVDRQGNIYITGGITGYPGNINFPVTEGCLDSQFSHYSDSSMRSNGFLSKLSPKGDLLYSSYLFHLNPHAINVDSSGAMYVVGTPASDKLFPITENAYKKEWDSSSDLLCKISPSGRDLIFSTYLFHASMYGLEIDSEGNIFIAGEASETPFFPSIPLTPDAYDSTYNGGMHDAFLCKMDPFGSKLLYLTYIGSPGYDLCRGLALDNSGNVYIAGSTDSSDFPTTEGAWDRTFNGGQDVWLCKFSFASGPVKVENTPRSFNLAPAHPNPFNPSTTISFSLPAPSHASLAVYDITGRKVRTLVSGPMSAGEHSITWDGRDDSGKPVASGVYISRLVAGERVASGKMVLVR